MAVADRRSVLDVAWAVVSAIPALGALIAWALVQDWRAGVASLLLVGVPFAVVIARRQRRRAQRLSGRAASRAHLRELGWVLLALALLIGGLLVFSALP